jgi:WD40 repeat protein
MPTEARSGEASPERCLIEVLNAKRHPVGRGIVAGHDPETGFGLIVTCAHVVNAALPGRVKGDPDRPEPFEITVRFPFSGAAGAKVDRSVTLVTWLPDGAATFAGRDMACLTMSEPLPPGTTVPTLVPGGYAGGPVRLVGLTGSEFVAKTPGYVTGTVLGRRDPGRYQVDQDITGDIRVREGSSGGPVWDRTTNQVVGLVQAIPRSETAVDVYVLGAELIEEASRHVLYQVLECPYVGLSAFEREDAHRFFGREKLIGEIAARTKKTSLLVVTGDSGSGKSSVVRAGLVARLAATPKMTIGVCDLSEQPFLDVVGALASACYDQPLAPKDIEVLLAKLDAESLDGCMALLRGSGRASKRLLLVLDQFERIEEADSAVKAKFLGMLGELAAKPAGNAQVIIVVRGDHLHHFTNIDGPLGDRFRTQALWVSAMSKQDLRTAITGPVADAALPVEFADGLVEQICQDLTDNRHLRGSPLPHLQIVLRLLWERQVGRKLTLRAYRELGGVSHALAQHADSCLADLGEDKREPARRILILLVMPETTDVARRVKLSAFRRDDLPVVDDLVNTRLITAVEGQAVPGEKTVEIAHETLLRSWKQLRDWVMELHDFAWWFGDTDIRRDEWIKEDRNAEYLLVGNRLTRAKLMCERFPEDARPITDFVAASATAAERAELDRRQALERDEAIRLAGQSELALGSAPAKLPIALALGICALRKQEVLEANSAVRRALAIAGQERLRIPHGGPVRSVVYSPDGKLLVTASDDGTCQVYHVATNSQVAQLRHPAGLASAVFNPAGTHVATGGADGVARVWDLHAQSQPATLPHKGPVTAVAFSPDGHRLATASNDGTARIWDWAADGPAMELPVSGLVTAVGFVSGLPLLVTVSYDGDDGDIRLWNTHTGQVTRQWKQDHPIRAFTFNHDGTRFATAGDDWTVRVFDPAAAEEVLCLKHQDSVAAVAFSPDGQHLASANDDGTARVWNVAQGFEVAHLVHANQVYSVHFSPDGISLATASEDQTARIWKVATGEELARLVHESTVCQAVFGPDCQTIATASEDATARVWQATAGGEVLTLPHGEPVTAICFAATRDDTIVATAGGTAAWDHSSAEGPPRMVRIWNGLSGEQVGDPLVHPAAVADIAFSGGMIATACADNHARLWDLASGTQVATVAHGGAVNSVAIDPAGRLLATASNDNSARLWDIQACVEVALLPHQDWVGSAVFCPDGVVLATAAAKVVCLWQISDCLADSSQPECRVLPHESVVYDILFDRLGTRIATVANDRVTRIWDARTGQLVQPIPHGSRGRFRAAFSPDGSLIATAGDDGIAQVWQTETGTHVAQFVHEPAVRSVMFTRDGSCLATVGEDGTVRIWSVRNGNRGEVTRLIHGGTDVIMAFSPDGRRVATAGADGYCRIWALTTEELIDLACARLTRNLSTSEWARYLPGVPYQPLCDEASETGGTTAPFRMT